MVEATLSSRNRIVIPTEIREALKVKPGDKLIFTVIENKMIIMEKPKFLERGNQQSSTHQLPA